MSLRDVNGEDCEQITALYNAVADESTTSWSRHHSAEETAQWLTLFVSDYPCIVAIGEDEGLSGYAAFEPSYETDHKGGFIYSPKISILIKEGHRREGLATLLFDQLSKHSKSRDRQFHLAICRLPTYIYMNTDSSREIPQVPSYLQTQPL